MLFSCIFQSCQDPVTPPDFYFPMPEKDEGYIYHYQSGSDLFPDEYWHIQAYGRGGLKICVLDVERGWRQCSFEMIVENGVLQDSLVIISDSLGTFNAEVLHGNLYPENPIDQTHVYLQYIKWYTTKDSSSFVELIRNRRYTPHSTRATNLGSKFVLFELNEMVEDFQEGYIEIPVSGLEVFEKGVGLVYFEKEITSDLVRKYTLNGEMTVEQFKQSTGWDVLSPP